MIKVIASTIEMSFDIPSDEKEKAESASSFFTAVISSLDHSKKHLDIIYIPFKKADNVSSDAVVEYRGAIYRFKEQVKRNFNKTKLIALKAIVLLNGFASDTHILELVNAFRDGIGKVEKQVTILLDILSDYRSQDFKNNVISGVEAIRREAFEVEKLINDRIIDYIDTNILAKDWMTATSNELEEKIESRVPFITQLFNERQKALEVGNETENRK